MDLTSIGASTPSPSPSTGSSRPSSSTRTAPAWAGRRRVRHPRLRPLVQPPTPPRGDRHRPQSSRPPISSDDPSHPGRFPITRASNEIRGGSVHATETRSPYQGLRSTPARRLNIAVTPCVAFRRSCSSGGQVAEKRRPDGGLCALRTDERDSDRKLPYMYDDLQP